MFLYTKINPVLQILILFSYTSVCYSNSTGIYPIASTISANEIVKELLAGKSVIHKNVVIKGNIVLPKNAKIIGKVEFSQCRFEGDFQSSASMFLDLTKFENVTFQGNVDFSGSTFHQLAVFDRTVFQGECHFLHSMFSQLGQFTHCTFQNKVNFTSSLFDAYANFSNSTFLKPAIFSFMKTQYGAFKESKFDEAAIFYETDFVKHVDFSAVHFGNRAYFLLAKLGEERTDFIGAQFYGTAGFNGTKFGSSTNFTNAKFFQDVNFNSEFKNVYFLWTTFNALADFKGSKIDELLSFTETTFEKRVDLRNVKFTENSKFFIKDIRVDEMLVSWSQIEGKVGFDKWEHPSLSEIQRAYYTLYNAFMNRGQFSDADNCYYELKEIERHMTPFWSFNYFFDYINWLFCGYGVRPYRAIKSVFIISIFFSFIYLLSGGPLKIGNLILKIKSFYSKQKNKPSKYFIVGKNVSRILNAFATYFYTLLYMLGLLVCIFTRSFFLSLNVFTNFGDSYWSIDGIYRYIAVFQGTLGWFLLGLFITTYTKILLR